jgi:hypothetical protein
LEIGIACRAQTHLTDGGSTANLALSKKASWNATFFGEAPWNGAIIFSSNARTQSMRSAGADAELFFCR